MTDKTWWIANREKVTQICRKLEEYNLLSNEDFLQPRSIIELIKGLSNEVTKLLNENGNLENQVRTLTEEKQKMLLEIQKTKKKSKEEIS